MKTPIKTIKFVVVGMILLNISCNHQNKNLPKDSITTRDMLGREVMIPKQIGKIVALNAGMLRLITWMDATDLVCGVEYNESKRQVPYLFAHPELSKKPVAGTGNIPEHELLITISPDVIFTTYTTKGEADKLQERTGIPVLAIQYGNFDDETDTLFNALKYLGKILHREERAFFLIKYINETIADLRKRTADIPEKERKLCYVGGISYRGSHGITSTEPRYPSFNFVNAINVAGSLAPVMTSSKDVLLNAFIDKEQLIEWNPEFIFLDMSANSYKNQLADEPWANLLSAIQNDNIYTVFPYNWYTINYSTILVNSYFIGKTLYPERFMDIHPEIKADEIYQSILGRPVYENMVDKYGNYKRLNLSDK